MTKKEKKRAAQTAAVLLLLLLGWKLAGAKTKTTPKGKVTVGPITVEDRDRDQYDDLRERRAQLRNKVLDLIGFDEDAWQPTRRPSLADKLVLDSIFAELAQIRPQVPDPEGHDAGFDSDLAGLVGQALSLDPSTSSRPPKAFGSSRYMTRVLAIEEEVRDLVALDAQRRVRRRPTDADMAVLHALIAERDALEQKLVAIDPEVDMELSHEPLEELVRAARALPASSSTVAAVSSFVPGSLPAV